MDINMILVPANKVGKVTKILVKENEIVKKDQDVCSVEAGKGTRNLKSPIDGKITSILVKDGDVVTSSMRLLVVDEIENEQEVEVKMIMIPANKIGKLVRYEVKKGAVVLKDQPICSVEAGKCVRVIKSPIDGVVTSLEVEEGSQVVTSQSLIKIKEQIIDKKEDENHTELLIIGAGPGGYVAALYAAKKGMKVTLVEKNKLGGTCLNVGCIPTKALVKSSEVVYEVKHSKIFGVDTSLNKIDMHQVIAHKNQVVTNLVNGIAGLMDKNNIHVLNGVACFLDSHTCLIKEENEEKEITFDKAIIATGGKISKIAIPGIDEDFILNSTTALSLEELPNSISIIGGGVIGMEFAFIYSHFGVKVNVIEYMDHLLGNIDEEAREFMLKKAQEEGINVLLKSKVVGFEKEEKLAKVVFEQDGILQNLLTDKVLVAIGRQAEFQSLNLDKAGVLLNATKRGIEVDEQMRTNVEHIFAIGDVTNKIQLAHVASHQGLVAVDAILGIKAKMHYDVVPSVIFTDPEVASVGYSAKEAKDLNINIKESRFSFASNGKALTMEKGEGFIKLVKDIDHNRLIGATIVGADASNLIATLTVAIKNNLSEKELISTIFAHPTTSEVIHEACLGLDIGSLHE